MHTDELRPRLLELADRARRLPPPNHRNPHAFHEARSELGHEIEQLADQVGPRRKGPQPVRPVRVRDAGSSQPAGAPTPITGNVR